MNYYLSGQRFYYTLKNYQLFQKILNLTFTPILFIIRKLSKLVQSNSNCVVILSFHKLGDTIFTIPAIKEILKNYKQNVYVFCFPESKEIFREELADISYVAINKDYFYMNERIANKKIRVMLRQINPKIIFDLTSSIKSASVLFNSKAEEIIGSNDEHFRAIYTHFVPMRKTPHIIDNYLDVINARVPVEEKYKLKVFKNNIGSTNEILIHLLAGWKAKEWKLIKYIELAEKMNLGYNICLVAQSNSLTKDVINEIHDKGLRFVAIKTVNELIKIIKGCAVFIGNDSGPLHLASMLGKPTLTIFGPTNPEFHLPRGDHHKFCKVEIRCSPRNEEKMCFTNGGRFGCPSFECMNQLPIEKVMLELSRSLLELNINKK